MGLGNFIENFIGGMAFGIFANSPYGFGMGGFGFGYGGGMRSNRVDFETFANPFPNIFGNATYTSTPSVFMYEGFANPNFPTIDFSQIGKTIWDNTFNPDSEYNKRLKEYYENLSKNNNTQNYNYQTNIIGYEMPFSSWYLPTQFNNNMPFFGLFQQQPVTRVEEKKADKVEKSEEKKKQDKVVKRDYKNSNLEFEAAYTKLNITDNRFKKIFEECILINEGRQRNKDIVIPKDVHSKNKNGVLQGTYNSYRKEKGLPTRDVEHMTAEEMCDIYYNKFYIASGADKIEDDKLALYVFDTDVNMGVGTGKKLLSRSGNNASRYEEERRKEYSHRKNFNTYKKGWYDRIDKTRNYADSALA